MVLDFYYVPGSAPCRAVRMTAKAVGVELNLKLTNLMAGEHLKPEFVAVSVQSTKNTQFNIVVVFFFSLQFFDGFLSKSIANRTHYK